jgi:hypothetical protein
MSGSSWLLASAILDSATRGMDADLDEPIADVLLSE